MPYIWILTCLLGFIGLQATEIDSPQAACDRPQIFAESVGPMFAFVYTDNALKKNASLRLESDGYRSKSQPIFTSLGASQKIDYDKTKGELIIPTSADYKIVYSAEAANEKPFFDQMAIAVNGKVIEKTIIPLIFNTITTDLFVLPLKSGDRVSLRLGTKVRKFNVVNNKTNFNTSGFIVRNEGVGNSLSLFVQKL
jgi:hypothetical protein